MTGPGPSNSTYVRPEFFATVRPVGAALAAGLILALATVHLAGPWGARFAFRFH